MKGVPEMLLLGLWVLSLTPILWPFFSASQFATEVAQAEMYAATSLQQRGQPGSDGAQHPRPVAAPSAPVIVGSTGLCTIGMKPAKLGLPLQTAAAPTSSVSQ
jgi:hypothetical protein